jgi:imidazolonepropionase
MTPGRVLEPTRDWWIRDARVVTPVPPASGGALRGPEMDRLRVLDRADVVVRDGAIVAVGPALRPDRGPGSAADLVEVDARGQVLLPGFVDAHTHACWSGDRLSEWEARLSGASYEELLAAGGGILSTVRAVRATPEPELAEGLLGRVKRAAMTGTTTMEVKSGYGLTADAELRMLRAIRSAADAWSGTLVPTALLGHALDPEHPGGEVAFVGYVVEELLPRVTREFPGIAVDAYCETGAWSVASCLHLFRAARAAGHPVRVHADQFRELGMVAEAVSGEIGARSVDHLEASGEGSIRALAASPTLGVLLPVSGFHLDDRYADGRRIVDAGGGVVVATNWNPGSAPSPSIPLAVALAVRRNGLTVAEAITAVTWNAASLLDLSDRGWIGPGARADLVLLSLSDERELAHTVGENPVARVLAGGRPIP